jgi:Uma2 family endonuclease
MSTHARPAVGYSVERYFALAASGVLRDEDHVELLDGVIIAEPPPGPEHASATTQVDRVFRRLLGDEAVIRIQQPFLAGPFSAPEPDVAVVPGREQDYHHQHPHTAHLIVEVAATSLPQDRLSKSRTYAAAAVPEYWIVNLRDGWVEIHRDPDPARATYRSREIAGRGERIPLRLAASATVAVDDLLPSPTD